MSYSTLNEARAAYLANADYADGAGDTTKAATFRTACRSLLVLLPQSVSSNATSMSFTVEKISAELDRVDRWIAGRSTTGGSAPRTVYANIQEFRS